MKLCLSFRLRTLFVLVTLFGIAFGWYSYRQRIINIERAKLHGTWEIRYFNGDAFYSGPIDFLRESVEIGLPSNGVGTIGTRMHDGSGISLGIYRFRDDVLEVAENAPGEPRPISFDEKSAKYIVIYKRVSPIVLESQQK